MHTDSAANNVSQIPKSNKKIVGFYKVAIGNWYIRQNNPIKCRRLPLKYMENKLAVYKKNFSIVDDYLTKSQMQSTSMLLRLNLEDA